MNSPPNTKDVLIARADQQLAGVRERIASVDEEIARVTERLSKMERDEVRNPSAGPEDAACDPSARPGPQPPRSTPAVPGSTGLLPIGLLLAACLVVAALVSLLYRDAVALDCSPLDAATRFDVILPAADKPAVVRAARSIL